MITSYDEILETLRTMEASHLDRQAVQKLFGVRERRARQLMAGLPGLQVGNTFAAARLALMARLEETAAGGLFQWEVNRRARVGDGPTVFTAGVSSMTAQSRYPWPRGGYQGAARGLRA